MKIRLPYLLVDPGYNFNVASNASLSSFSAPNIRLTKTGTSLSYAAFNLAGCSINSADLDSLYNNMAMSLSSGYPYYVHITTNSGTNGALTAASSLAISSLYLGASAHYITIAHN